VPRTSGTDILYELQRAVKLPTSTARLYVPGILEFMHDKEKTKSFNILTGHFASNPVRELENVVTFSIIRRPIDQYLSTAAYRFLTDNVEFTSKDLDRFIEGEFDVFGAFQGFSGCSNPQSKFLAAKLVKFYDETDNREMYSFVDEPSSLEDVKKFIDSSIIGSLENRHIVIEKVNKVLLREFGTQIAANTRRTNTTMPISFTVSTVQKNKIMDRLQLDEEVYQYVKTIEKRENARR
jgi:hypothetical protein